MGFVVYLVDAFGAQTVTNLTPQISLKMIQSSMAATVSDMHFLFSNDKHSKFLQVCLRDGMTFLIQLPTKLKSNFGN